MSPDSAVLEVGSRYGTVSYTISKRQQQSGFRVSVEPDRNAKLNYLDVNTQNNNCAGLNVCGVVGKSNASLPKDVGSYSQKTIKNEKAIFQA